MWRRAGGRDRLTAFMTTLTTSYRGCPGDADRRQKQEVTSSVLDPPRLPEAGSEPTRVAARPLTPHVFHTFVNKNSNVVKSLFVY